MMYQNGTCLQNRPNKFPKKPFMISLKLIKLCCLSKAEKFRELKILQLFTSMKCIIMEMRILRDLSLNFVKISKSLQ